MLQVTQGIDDHQETCCMAVRPPQFLKCARIESDWSKALHSGVASMGCHCIAAAFEDW
jgi:hypothetical protein